MGFLYIIASFLSCTATLTLLLALLFPHLASAFSSTTDLSSRGLFITPSSSTPSGPRNDTAARLTLTQWRSDLKCYALPYGGIGVASHMLTYYGLIMVLLGRKPLMPWKQAKFGLLSLGLGLVQLVGTIYLGVRTIVRCNGNTYFVRFSVWMITTSVASGLATMLGTGEWIVQSVWGRKTRTETENGYREGEAEYREWQRAQAEQAQVEQVPDHSFRKIFKTNPFKDIFIAEPFTEIFGADRIPPFPWTYIPIGLIWVAGSLLGMITGIQITTKLWHVAPALRIVTLACLVPMVVVLYFFVGIVTSTLGCWSKSWRVTRNVMGSVLGVGLFLMLIYMDLLIAAMNGNWAGLPPVSNDAVAAYWSYFALKRLPFLTL